MHHLDFPPFNAKQHLHRLTKPVTMVFDGVLLQVEAEAQEQRRDLLRRQSPGRQTARRRPLRSPDRARDRGSDSEDDYDGLETGRGQDFGAKDAALAAQKGRLDCKIAFLFCSSLLRPSASIRPHLSIAFGDSGIIF